MHTNRASQARVLLVAFCAAIAGAAAASAGNPLTIGDLTSEPPISGRPVIGLSWRPHSTEFSYLVRKGEGEEAVFELWVEDAAKGGKRLLVATPALVIPAEAKPEQAVPAAVPGEDEKPARRRVALEGYRWAPDGQALLLTGGHDLWIYRLPAGKLAPSAKLDRLTHDPEDEEVPTFSPDGRRVAFVRKNDLYVLDLASGQEQRLTSDGAPHALNG